MDQGIAERLGEIRERIAAAARRFDPPGRKVTLIAVSKGFGEDHIRAALDAGQRDFGENRVQEAEKKWPALKRDNPGVKLHLIGPLQTNKVKDSVALFDVIHTVDREKIAAALAAEMVRAGKRLPVFVEVNIGAEAQKAGIGVKEAVGFVERCRKVHGLEVLGLMCIPPAEEAPGPYFAQLALLAAAARVESLSMGMSADFATAIEMGATHLRVGSAIFGAREV
ncbi:MAG: YggS family pyridoxal phosphate-dependent enzyme [Cucumibacter sp.]